MNDLTLLTFDEAQVLGSRPPARRFANTRRQCRLVISLFGLQKSCGCFNRGRLFWRRHRMYIFLAAPGTHIFSRELARSR